MRKASHSILFVCLVLVGLLAATWAGQTPSQRPMKNVIVLIPDGCGATHTTLTRWYLHWSPDLSAEQGQFTAYPEPASLALDEMNIGCVRNWATNSLVTDSAPAATAFATGYKTADKFISVLPDASSIPGYRRHAHRIDHHHRPLDPHPVQDLRHGLALADLPLSHHVLPDLPRLDLAHPHRHRHHLHHRPDAQ